MIQGGERSGFALEARHALGIGHEQLGQDFDRDLAIELRVPRANTSPMAPAPRAPRISYGPTLVPVIRAPALSSVLSSTSNF
jgi:hypothetical protein